MTDDVRLFDLTLDWSEQAKKDKLYIAVMLDDADELERLRSQGTGLSDHVRDMLKTGGGSYLKPNSYYRDWREFCDVLSNFSPAKFISVIRNLRAELGEPVHFSKAVLSNVPKFYRPDVFKCVLDCFDNRKMNKTQTLLYIIDHNIAGSLRIAAKHGWLRNVKKCDELISYARSKNCVECAAFLIDHKNKNFDLALEREKEEKRKNAILNASPNSVVMMKMLWTCKKLKDGTLLIKRYNGRRTDIVVPEKIGRTAVTVLGEDLEPVGFRGNEFASEEVQRSATKITLPKGLKKIGVRAFCNFEKLSEISIPDGMESIGAYAFYNCKELKELTLPDSISEIGLAAFLNCEELKKINIPKGLTEISALTFANCGKLEAIDFPEGIKYIDEFAFDRCNSIRSVRIPSGVTVIANSAFCDCDSLTEVELPDTLIDIMEFAFINCPSLKEVVIPEGVQWVGDGLFCNCKSLERVVLPASLKRVIIQPNRIRLDNIFHHSPNVTAVVTPDSFAEKYCRNRGIPIVYA